MKKILLLIVSGLLFACMAGSAMANQLDIVYANGTTATDHTLYFNNGDSKQLYLKVTYNDANPANLGLKTFVATVGRTDDPSGDVHLFVTPNSQTFNLLVGGSPFVDYTAPLTLSVSGAKPNEMYTVYVDGEEAFHVEANVDVTTVPEFQTLAVPVFAIIGLLFIFGRKKEGL